MRYRKTIKSRLSDLAGVRRWLRVRLQAAAFDDTAMHKMELAITEALANVIRHAYRGEEAGVIHISLVVDHSLVRVVIRDFAEPFTPLDSGDAAAQPHPSPKGGVGMYILRQAMDVIRYEHPPPTGTRLTMERRCHSPVPDAPRGPLP